MVKIKFVPQILEENGFKTSNISINSHFFSLFALKIYVDLHFLWYKIHKTELLIKIPIFAKSVNNNVSILKAKKAISPKIKR